MLAQKISLEESPSPVENVVLRFLTTVPDILVWGFARLPERSLLATEDYRAHI